MTGCHMSEQRVPPVPKPDSAVTPTSAPASRATTTLGPYQLLQKIGEGGMGEVWMAEQTAPMRRLVAVTIIKAGMDTARVVARFEAERQALALMDHPVCWRTFRFRGCHGDSRRSSQRLPRHLRICQ
jgi:serine/threonine protein kinase